MKISWQKQTLIFKRAVGTSRSILDLNDVWYVKIENDGRVGVGECNPLVGLSLDDRPDFEVLLDQFVDEFNKTMHIDLARLNDYPAMKFAFESALLDLKMGGTKVLFPSKFTQGEASMSINGLLWMGSKKFMLDQLNEKLNAGFSCIKMKIGAIDFNEELAILKEIRANFTSSQIELRVDANGAFKSSEAMGKLDKLAAFEIHSIEQPIEVGQWEEMKELVKNSPIPIALDEELIPLRKKEERLEMLQQIKPDYIILKPSLVGGFADCDEWIELAEANNIKWWMTSALESNIGLNAIAQYAYSKDVVLPQGLGTGALYSNNIDSPLYISKGALFSDPNKKWGKL